MHTHLGREITTAVRRLLRSPIYASFAIAMFSLGIGTAVASLAAARSFLAPPGSQTTANIVNLYHEDPFERGNLSRKSFQWTEYQATINAVPAFDALIAHGRFRQAVTFDSGVDLVWGEFVSGNYFDVLQVAPVVGRLMRPSDDRPASAPVAVLSHTLWERILGSNPRVVGSTIRINKQVFEVVGVASQAFRGTFAPELLPTDVWVPLAHARSLEAPADTNGDSGTDYDKRWLLLKGRLRSGVSIADARTQIATIAARLDRVGPLAPDGGRYDRAGPLRRWVVIPANSIRLNGRDGFFKSLAAAGVTALLLVVLIACTNVANLTVARMQARKKEMAIRRWLGASQRQIVWEQVVESALIAIVSGGLGIWVAHLLLRVSTQAVVVGPGRAFRLDPPFDSFVIATAIGATSVILLVFGILPVATIVRENLRHALRRHGDDPMPPDWRSRRQLIAMQVAVSVALLAAAAICVLRAQEHLRRTSAIELEGLAIVQMMLPSVDADRQAFTTVVNSGARLFGQQLKLESVTVASGVPVLTDTPSADVWRDGALSDMNRLRVRLVATAPNFATTVGLRVLRGRTFVSSDEEGRDPVAIVSRRLADLLGFAGDVVGQRVDYQRVRTSGERTWPRESARIVGIVEDIGEDDGAKQPGMDLYVPMSQKSQRLLAVIARTDGRADVAAAAIFKGLRNIDPELPITFVGTAEQLMSAQMVLPRAGRFLMSLLGLVAFVLALVGLYGILTFVVEARQREIGIRMALGATERQVTAWLLRDGLAPVAIGLLMGVGAAALLWSAVARVLLLTYSMPVPIVVLSSIAISLFTAAFIACRIPAMRAARLSPAEILRHG